MTFSTIQSALSNGLRSLRTKHLTIVSTLDLTHHPEGPAVPDYTLDPSAEVLPFSYAEQDAPDLSGLAKPQLPDPDGIGRGMGAPLRFRAWKDPDLKDAGGYDPCNQGRVSLSGAP